MKPGPDWYICDEPTVLSRLKTVWDIGTILTAFGFALAAYGVESLLEWTDEL